MAAVVVAAAAVCGIGIACTNAMPGGCACTGLLLASIKPAAYFLHLLRSQCGMRSVASVIACVAALGVFSLFTMGHAWHMTPSSGIGPCGWMGDQILLVANRQVSPGCLGPPERPPQHQTGPSPEKKSPSGPG